VLSAKRLNLQTNLAEGKKTVNLAQVHLGKNITRLIKKSLGGEREKKVSGKGLRSKKKPI
jgi:hypothetical protein